MEEVTHLERWVEGVNYRTAVLQTHTAVPEIVSPATAPPQRPTLCRQMVCAARCIISQSVHRDNVTLYQDTTAIQPIIAALGTAFLALVPLIMAGRVWMARVDQASPETKHARVPSLECVARHQATAATLPLIAGLVVAIQVLVPRCQNQKEAYIQILRQLVV